MKRLYVPDYRYDATRYRYVTFVETVRLNDTPSEAELTARGWYVHRRRPVAGHASAAVDLTIAYGGLVEIQQRKAIDDA